MLADKAYIGDHHFITPFKPAQTEAEKYFNTQVHKQRQKIEKIIRRIKIWRAVKCVWRHGIELHYYVFHVIANITYLLLIINPLDKYIISLNSNHVTRNRKKIRREFVITKSVVLNQKEFINQ